MLFESRETSREEFVDNYSKEYLNQKKYPKNDESSEQYIEKMMKNDGKVDFRCIAWKMGIDHQKYAEAFEKGDIVPNGYGKPIKGLNTYLQYIEDKSDCLRDLIGAENNRITSDNMKEAFKLLVEESPDNFGTVYIITVMFFLSKGKIPIYDSFAHKAIKAIYFEKQPSEIYVGDAPSKRKNNKAKEINSKDAINMLEEYMWLVDQVFGTEPGKHHVVERKEDQALWAYGHKQ